MFTGEMFLAAARESVQSGNEGGGRTAVSRAYYAAFWVAREVVETGGVPVPETDSGRSHDNLWDMLVNEYGAKNLSLGAA